MNSTRHPTSFAFLRTSMLAAAFLMPLVRAEEPALSAQALSSRLASAVQDGSSAVRLKMEITSGGNKTAFQLQIKSRRTQASSEIIYQVLWPKDRKGESFLLRKSGNQAASGAVFTLPDTLKTLSSSQMQEGIFGSQLTYEDVVENFFAWEKQAITGTETVDRVSCQVLESKPGKGDRSTYGLVKSWVDVKKMTPLRIEKYLPSGQLACRIDTTRVAKDDTDRPVPASMTVRRAGQTSVTEIEGSNSKHDVKFQDADFTPEALRALAQKAK